MGILDYLFIATFGALAAAAISKVTASLPRQSGLLSSRTQGPVELERLQSLVVALGGAGVYAIIGARAFFSGSENLPEVPPELLGVVGLSQLVFVGGKAYRRRRQTQHT